MESVFTCASAGSECHSKRRVADVDNRFFAEESVKVKAAEVSKVEAQKYNDARKWSIGSRDAKTRAAAAREQLRVLERFEVEQPDVEPSRVVPCGLAPLRRRTHLYL